MLLEPEKNLVLNSELSRRGSKAWKEQEEMLGDDQILLPEGEYDQCQKMVDGCLQNKMARNLLTNGDLLAEYSFMATCPETGLRAEMQTRWAVKRGWYSNRPKVMLGRILSRL